MRARPKVILAVLLIGLGAFLVLVPMIPERINYVQECRCPGDIIQTPIAYTSLNYFLFGWGGMYVHLVKTPPNDWITWHRCNVSANQGAEGIRATDICYLPNVS